MAPESMSQSIYNCASDVYSFGVVAWELFTEETAFLGLEGYQLIDHVVNQRLGLPLENLGSLDPSVKELISGAMQYRPEDRPDAATLCKGISLSCRSK